MSAQRTLLGEVASVVLCALFGASASAVDVEGYVRAGTGSASERDRTCYDLDITGGHYRLGNECDLYGEIGVAQAATLDGASYRGLVMVNYRHPQPDGSGSSGGVEQAYVSGRGLSGAPDVDLWIGKRFYGRADVHILDTKFVRMDGAGVGGDNIALGSARLGVAYFRTDAGSGAQPGTEPSRQVSRRLNVDVTQIGVGDGGKLRLTATFTRGHSDNTTGASGTSGAAVSVQHDLGFDSNGATNTTWLQWARGSAGLDGNFGTMTTEPEVQRWRLVDSVSWQAGPFGGQAVALYGRHERDAVNGIAGYAEWSAGGRVSYAITHHIKLVTEAGYMEKRPEGSETQRLAKLTVSPMWSAGPKFFDRPEFRIYVTAARWNDAANAAAGPAGLAGLGDGETRGVSVGAQFETWF